MEIATVPNFGVDHDIIHSQKNIADQETAKGAWNIKKNEDGNFEVPHIYNDVMKGGTPSEIAVGPIGFKAMAQIGQKSHHHARH